MLKLYAKDYTSTAVNYGADSFIKLMAVNQGRNVAILIDGKTISMPVNEFYTKMKAMFLNE